MTTFALGIDPGLSGAIALLRNGEFAEVCGMAELTQSRLREVLSYDSGSGQFIWLSGQRARMYAGTFHKAGYRQIQIDGRIYKAHRLAWLYVHGRFPANHIDHINGDNADNRIANLREATNAENRQNMKQCRRDKTVGHLGAFWVARRGKWEARISINGRSKFLGYFEAESEAYAAYGAAKRVSHPFWVSAEDLPIPYRITDKGRAMLKGDE